MALIARYWRAQPVFWMLLFAAVPMLSLIPASYVSAPGQGLFAQEICTDEQYPATGARGGSKSHEATRADRNSRASKSNNASSRASESRPRTHALFGQSPLVDAAPPHHRNILSA